MNTRWLIVPTRPANAPISAESPPRDRDRVQLDEERAAKPDHRARDVHEQQEFVPGHVTARVL